MIEPTKHLDLELSVLRVSALVLKELMKKRIVKHDELMRKLVDMTNDDVKLTLMPALNFLYIIGRIEYHQKTDSFEYIEVSDNNK